MTRKDYIHLATALTKARPSSQSTPAYFAWSRTVEAVAAALQEDNPKFNPYKFTQATLQIIPK